MFTHTHTLKYTNFQFKKLYIKYLFDSVKALHIGHTFRLKKRKKLFCKLFVVDLSTL